MRKSVRLVGVIAAFALMVGDANKLAAESLFAAAQAQELLPVDGELLSVNTDTMTIVVKTSNGAEAHFRYTNQTTVTGADRGVEGLATMHGVPVTVYFKIEGAFNVATRIDVQQIKPQA